MTEPVSKIALSFYHIERTFNRDLEHMEDKLFLFKTMLDEPWDKSQVPLKAKIKSAIEKLEGAVKDLQIELADNQIKVNHGLLDRYILRKREGADG